MTRVRHPRVIRVRLECGHEASLNTGRYRVTRALKGILFGNAVRAGVWCWSCRAKCLPVESLGTCRA